MDYLKVLSVPHTGTIFTKFTLSNNLCREVQYEHFEVHHLQNTLPRVIVSPIRHPQKVFESFYKQGHFGEKFFRYWGIFNELYLRNKLMILPIDLESRESHLKVIGDKIGIILETDWRAINKTDVKPDYIPEIDLSKVLALPVVNDFYN